MLKLFKHKTVKIIAVIMLAVIAFVLFVAVDKREVGKIEKKAYDIEKLTLNKISQRVDSRARKLMIVAHPDDEILFGGGHLMSGDYLVVCVTNGRNKTRSKEFEEVMTASGNEFIMLEYPDKVGDKRDLWVNVRAQLTQDLEMIMKFKDWEQITVHNQAGEYGHIHHQNVHSIVTEIYDRNGLPMPLYNFGQYYKASEMDSVKDKLVPLSDEEYDFKCELAEKYTSQKKTLNKLWHIAKYEMWTEYEPYSENPFLKRNANEERRENKIDEA